MYHNKTEVVSKLLDILIGLKIQDENDVTVELDKIITPYQRYKIIMALANNLPLDVHGLVKEYDNKINTKIEDTHVVTDYQFIPNEYEKLLKEVLLLGSALGFNWYSLYSMVSSIDRVNQEDVSITNVFGRLINVIMKAERHIDIMNLSPVRYEGIEEVHRSNMTRLIPFNAPTTIKESVAILSTKYNVITEDLKNGYVVIKDRDTNDVLNPISYRLPNLEILIYKHLNKKNNE